MFESLSPIEVALVKKIGGSGGGGGEASTLKGKVVETGVVLLGRISIVVTKSGIIEEVS